MRERSKGTPQSLEILTSRIIQAKGPWQSKLLTSTAVRVAASAADLLSSGFPRRVQTKKWVGCRKSSKPACVGSREPKQHGFHTIHRAIVSICFRNYLVRMLSSFGARYAPSPHENLGSRIGKRSGSLGNRLVVNDLISNNYGQCAAANRSPGRRKEANRRRPGARPTIDDSEPILKLV
jgi:hypothetical protein